MLLRYVGRRLLLLIPTLLATILLVFLMIALGGGNPAYAGGQVPSHSAVVAFDKLNGLNQPLPVRFVHFIGNLVTGHLGQSLVTGEPVGQLIGNALPITLELTACALIIAAVIALIGGLIAALFRGKLPDLIVRIVSAVLIASPNFWIGLLAIDLFSVQNRWLPASGYVSLAHGFSPWLKAMVLPAFALGLPVAGVLTRVVRTSMLEELDKDYVRTALGSGLPRRVVIGRNVLRNALVSPLTVIGLYFGYLLAGAVLIETVFALPGIGQLMVTSVLNGDLFVVRVAVIVTVSLFLLANLTIDVTYFLLNPRVRTR